MASEAETKVRLILKKYLYKDEVNKVIQEFERQGVVLTTLYSPGKLRTDPPPPSRI